MKQIIWIGVFLGSTVGGAIPLLWGVSAFSITSVLFSMFGGIVGIIVGYKIGQRYF